MRKKQKNIGFRKMCIRREELSQSMDSNKQNEVQFAVSQQNQNVQNEFQYGFPSTSTCPGTDVEVNSDENSNHCVVRELFLQNDEKMIDSCVSDSIDDNEEPFRESEEKTGTDTEEPHTTDDYSTKYPANELLHPSLKLSRMEVMFILMNMFLRHNLSNVALCDMLEMINLIVGFKSLPETYSDFSRFFTKNGYTRHYVCGTCDLYIGETLTSCSNCKSILFQIYEIF